MNDSSTNWRMVIYSVGSCWLIFGLMLVLLGRSFTLFLNPLPLLVKAIFGIIVFGYVGGTRGWNIETVFVYWTLLGLSLSWSFHQFKTKRAWIIVGAAMVHLILAALSLFPMMLINGR